MLTDYSMQRAATQLCASARDADEPLMVTYEGGSLHIEPRDMGERRVLRGARFLGIYQDSNALRLREHFLEDALELQLELETLVPNALARL